MGEKECHRNIDIFGDNRLRCWTHERVGCRGIIIQNDRILVSHETKADYYLIPGGGLEIGETLEECCMREVREETGYIVKPVRQYLTINEYYGDCKFVGHYFICDVIDILPNFYVYHTKLDFTAFL